MYNVSVQSSVHTNANSIPCFLQDECRISSKIVKT